MKLKFDKFVEQTLNKINEDELEDLENLENTGNAEMGVPDMADGLEDIVAGGEEEMEEGEVVKETICKDGKRVVIEQEGGLYEAAVYCEEMEEAEKAFDTLVELCGGEEEDAEDDESDDEAEEDAEDDESDDEAEEEAEEDEEEDE